MHTLVGVSARAASRLCWKVTGEWEGGNVTHNPKSWRARLQTGRCYAQMAIKMSAVFSYLNLCVFGFVFESMCFWNEEVHKSDPALYFVKF